MRLGYRRRVGRVGRVIAGGTTTTARQSQIRHELLQGFAGFRGRGAALAERAGPEGEQRAALCHARAPRDGAQDASVELIVQVAESLGLCVGCQQVWQGRRGEGLKGQRYECRERFCRRAR